MPKKSQKDKSNPYPNDKYVDVILSDLILYSVFSLEKKLIDTTFPNIVAECFELFPKKFLLQGFPDYPDSQRVHREIWRMTKNTLTHERLVKGSARSNYHLTEKGLSRMMELDALLKLDVDDSSRISKAIQDRRQKIGNILHAVEKNSLFGEYSQGKKDIPIPEPFLRDLLFSTMETSHEKLRDNMKTLIEYCDIGKRGDIEEFLQYCMKCHNDIFDVNKKNTSTDEDKIIDI